MATTNHVTLTLTDGVRFEGRGSGSAAVVVEGAESLGGKGEGMRPMELLLVSLASCSAMDVINILRKQRQTLTGMQVHVEGKRADAVPAVYTDIHVRFVVQGDVDENKLEKAVALSMEKYCSVTRMLESTAKITHAASVTR